MRPARRREGHGARRRGAPEAAFAREVARRIAGGRPFALASVGLEPGGRAEAALLRRALREASGPDDLLADGAAGDTLLLTQPPRLEAVLARVMGVFDALCAGRARLAVGATSSERRGFASFGEAAEAARALRRFAAAVRAPAC